MLWQWVVPNTMQDQGVYIFKGRVLQDGKQEGQCTYNTTLRHACKSLLLWKCNKYYLLVCVRMWVSRYVGVCCTYVNVALLLQHTMRMHHILSFVASRSPPYFSTLSHKWCTFWKKKLLNIKCVLIFSMTFVWNISHSKKNLARYHQKCWNSFMELEYYWQTLNIKFTQNPFSDSQVIPCRQMDIMKLSCFSKFCECA